MFYAKLITAFLLSLHSISGHYGQDDCEDDPFADICTREVLLNMDFDEVRPVIGDTWNYFTAGSFTGNDGALTFGSNGAELVSDPFTSWVAPNPFPELDHVKYFLLTAATTTVQPNSILTVDWIASVEISGVNQSPFPDNIIQKNDVRLAFANFAAYDPIQDINNGFGVTNDRIYAIFDRLPFQRPALGPYACYTAFIPIAKRRPGDLNKMTITFDPNERIISWYVDGVQKLSSSKSGYYPQRDYLGIDLGGVQEHVFPNDLLFGFGSFTALNSYPVCKDAYGRPDKCQFPADRMALVKLGDANASAAYNPMIGVPIPAQFYDADGNVQENHIWGQGLKMNIRKLKVVSEICESPLDIENKK